MEITIKFEENAKPETIWAWLQQVNEVSKETEGKITIIGPSELMGRIN